MAKRSVQSVKNSLKFKAKPKGGVLYVRVGVKKYAIPVEARLLAGEGHMFLSFPSTSELFKVNGKALAAMGGNEDATEAFEKLNPGRKGRRRRARIEMPDKLAEALRALPSGYKLGYTPEGSPKLIKTRKRMVRRATTRRRARV